MSGFKMSLPWGFKWACSVLAVSSNSSLGSQSRMSLSSKHPRKRQTLGFFFMLSRMDGSLPQHFRTNETHQTDSDHGFEPRNYRKYWHKNVVLIQILVWCGSTCFSSSGQNPTQSPPWNWLSCQLSSGWHNLKVAVHPGPHIRGLKFVLHFQAFKV